MCIQISLYGSQSAPPIASCFFSRLGLERNRCPQKTVILSTCSCLRKSCCSFGSSRPGTGLHASVEETLIILAVHSSSGRNVKVSCTQVCIVLHLRSSELDSFFRPTTSCLAISIPWCTHCVASRFCDDEECVSQVRFNVQELSSLICPDSVHSVQQQKTLRIGIFESKCSHAFCCVF